MVNDLDIGDPIELLTQPAANAKDLRRNLWAADNGGQWKIVEHLRANLTELFIGMTFDDFLAEAELLGNISAFVVALRDSDRVEVFDLQAEERDDRLDQLQSTINVVAHEEVIRIECLTTDAEQLMQVFVLTMDVVADHNPDINLHNVGQNCKERSHLPVDRVHFVDRWQTTSSIFLMIESIKD
jgi:hypothetical protein